jgi:hypothetical protein
MRIKLDLEFHVEEEKADQIPAQFGNTLEYLIGDIVSVGGSGEQGGFSG